MRTFKALLSALLVVSLTIATSCSSQVLSGSSSGSSGGDSGYAPISIPSGKYITGVSLLIDFGATSARLSTAASSQGYSFDGNPSVSYSKTSALSATLTWSAKLKTSKGQSVNNTGSVTLFFLSPSEGYASGTYNGASISDRHFTLL